MKFRYSKLFALLILVLSMGLTSPASAHVEYTKTSGKVTVETDDIWIEITGKSNVAAYFFRSQSDSQGTRHRAQFVELFEFNDNNDNGKYDKGDSKVTGTIVALSSLDVALGAVAETGDTSTTVSFNMSMTAKAAVTLNFNKISFENHVSEDNQTRLKFDVVIDSYSAGVTSGDMLGLAFKLSSSKSNNTTFNGGSQRSSVQFGQNAYLESTTTAKVDDTTIDVGMSVNTTAEGEIMTYFAYNQFVGTLKHDPTFGVQSSGVDEDDGLGDDNITALPINWGIIGITMAMIPILRKISH